MEWFSGESPLSPNPALSSPPKQGTHEEPGRLLGLRPLLCLWRQGMTPRQDRSLV